MRLAALLLVVLIAAPTTRAAETAGCCLVWTVSNGGLSQGTGVVIDPVERLVVTCRHVLRGEHIEVLFPLANPDGQIATTPTRYHDLRKNGKTIAARIIHADAALDLAVLQLESLPAPASLRWATANGRTGDAVTLVGNPVLRNVMWAQVTGKLKAVEPAAWTWPDRHRFAARVLKIRTADGPDFGYSGGPVLNQAGELAGIVVAGRPEESHVYAVDIAEVKKAVAAAYLALVYRRLLRAEPAAAQALVEKARRLDATSPLPWTAQGDIACLQGNRVKAISCYRRALACGPQQIGTGYRLMALLLIGAFLGS